MVGRHGRVGEGSKAHGWVSRLDLGGGREPGVVNKVHHHQISVELPFGRPPDQTATERSMDAIEWGNRKPAIGRMESDHGKG